MGDEGRVRRPNDVVTAVIGVLLVAWAIVASDQLPDWAQSLTQFVASSPEWVHILLAIAYLLSLIYALIVTFALIFGRTKHPGAVRDLLIVLIGSTVLVLLLSWLVNGAWPYVYPELGLQDPVPRFPVARVAVVTSILLVASPYVTRPLRWFGWVAIVTTAFAAIGLAYGSPIHTIGSFGLGLFSASLLLIIVGTPKGYPSPEAVASSMEAIGLECHNIRPAKREHWGLVRFDAEDISGRHISIKVHGRDSVDSQFWAKVWRTLIYRELTKTFSYSRLQAVEHEALASMVASRAGVPVTEMAAVGSATSEIALVALVDEGMPLDQLTPDEITDRVLISAWEHVRSLHDANVTHGGLGAESVRVLGDQTLLTDFGLASLAPGHDDRAGDVVELLFSLGMLVGPDRAVATALEGMGAEALVDALPYMQVPAISSGSRRKADKPKDLVKATRKVMIDATGAEEPEPVKLRRVTGRSIVMGALILLVISALLPLFTEVDYAQIWDVLQNADWALIVVALIVGHLQYIPQATSTMFAVTVTLPFWPMIVLQTASQFISLAIPSAAGRVAMNTTFLHKFGLSITQALTQGSIDGFSGFIVQVLLLLLVWLTGSVDLGLNVDTEDVPWLLILGLLALLIVIVILVVTRVQRLRDRIVPVVKEAWAALRAVLKQPSRALGLLGSNFVYWNLLGIILWLILEAVGSPIGYGSALFVAAGTSLFAGFMPVPGGVGVAEAAMTALLATFGVDQSTAFAATAVYRVITFYLPALEGFFGVRWLERNDYV